MFGFDNMNKLKRDMKLRVVGQLVVVGSFVGLGLLKVVQILIDLDEQELY